jgi:hypothetical protein
MQMKAPVTPFKIPMTVSDAACFVPPLRQLDKLRAVERDAPRRPAHGACDATLFRFCCVVGGARGGGVGATQRISHVLNWNLAFIISYWESGAF